IIEAFRHRARTLDDGARIEAEVVSLKAIVLGVLHVVEDLGRAQQRLGRDAAPVETDTAKIRALDDLSLETELRGPDRGDVAAGAGTDDDDVEIRVSHVSFSPRTDGLIFVFARTSAT